MAILPEIALDDVEFEYEFSDGQGFECRPDMYCGLCCSMQFNVTCHEIDRINNFLKDWLSSVKFRDFVLNHLTYLAIPIKFTSFHLQKKYEKYKRAFETFFKPSYFIEKDSTFYITHYRLASHRSTQRCIFFDPITYECAIYDVRPKECRIYPFNFEYNFRISKRVKVFIVEKCEGLEGTKPLNKSSLRVSIKDNMKQLFEQNKSIQEWGERNNVSIHMPLEFFQEREIRKMRKEMPKIAAMLEKTQISKKKTKISEIRDVLLEEQIISCLNVEAYKSYLSQLRRSKEPASDWI